MRKQQYEIRFVVLEKKGNNFLWSTAREGEMKLLKETNMPTYYKVS